MQPSIFGKQLEDVEFSDVIAFCAAKPKEGLGLDYKKDLSSLPNVIKTLVSFANTNGGWLIAGVEDDGNDAPKLPVTGMAYADNLVQKINNGIVSMVSPIVLPFYKVCKSADGKKAFVVAYMPQSQAAPHWMQYKNRNTLFIRVADRASGQDWEQYASGNEWEMMRNRRQASVNLGNQLVSTMKEVFETRFGFVEDEEAEREREEERRANPFGVLAVAPYSPAAFFEGRQYEKAQTISILPSYPTKPVTDISTVQHMITNEPISNAISTYRPQTPDRRGYDSKIYQNGAYTFHHDERINGCYFYGVDVFGNMITVDPIELSRHVAHDGIEETFHFLTVELVVMHIVGALKFADKVYSRIGLLGNLLFRAEYSGSRNCLMYVDHTDFKFDVNNKPENVTGTYLIQKETDTNTLADTDARNNFVLEVMREILQSFNFGGVTDAQILKVIEKADSIPHR